MKWGDSQHKHRQSVQPNGSRISMLWVQCTCSLLKAVLQRLGLATTSFCQGWCSTSSDLLWKNSGLWMVEISPNALISLFLLSQCMSLSRTTLLFPSYLPLTLQNSINDIQKTGCMAPADWSDTVLEAICARTEVDTKSSYIPAKHSTTLSFLQNANVFISLVKTVFLNQEPMPKLQHVHYIPAYLHMAKGMFHC